MKYDIAKLPKWAQQHIENTERARDELLKDRERTVQGDTNVWLQGYRSDDDQPLPSGSAIIFNLDGGRLRVTEKDGMLRLMAPHGALSILPEGGVNVVKVDIVQYR